MSITNFILKLYNVCLIFIKNKKKTKFACKRISFFSFAHFRIFLPYMSRLSDNFSKRMLPKCKRVRYTKSTTFFAIRSKMFVSRFQTVGRNFCWLACISTGNLIRFKLLTSLRAKNHFIPLDIGIHITTFFLNIYIYICIR